MDILFGSLIGGLIVMIAYWVGNNVGNREGGYEGYEEGYHQGFTDAENSLISKGFPLSEGGNFYSTNKAMQDISKKKDGD